MQKYSRCFQCSSSLPICKQAKLLQHFQLMCKPKVISRADEPSRWIIVDSVCACVYLCVSVRVHTEKWKLWQTAAHTICCCAPHKCYTQTQITQTNTPQKNVLYSRGQAMISAHQSRL